MTSEREAALIAALGELVALKYGPRDERYRKAQEAAWARVAQFLGPNAYKAELDRGNVAARFQSDGICCRLGTNGLICAEPRFHKGNHSAKVTWPQVARA